MAKKKSFPNQNLSPKKLLGFTILFFLLLAIPITLFAVGNPVSFFAEAARYDRVCNQKCSSQGYGNGYTSNRFRPCGPYTTKVDNCCCSEAVSRYERKFGCVSPCQKAGYEYGFAEEGISCSQRAPGQDTAIIGKCCCNRKPLPDLQVTDILWPKNAPKPSEGNYVISGYYFKDAGFPIANVVNASKFFTKESGVIKSTTSTIAKNVKVVFWLNCQSKSGWTPNDCAGAWTQLNGTGWSDQWAGVYSLPDVLRLKSSLLSYVNPGSPPRSVVLMMGCPQNVAVAGPEACKHWCGQGKSTVKFKVCADPDNKIKESDETNNCLEKVLNCDSDLIY